MSKNFKLEQCLLVLLFSFIFFKHLYTVLVEILLDFRFRFLHNFVLRLQLILDQKSLCSGMRKFLARQSFLFLHVYTKARFYKSFNSTSIYYLMILFINCTVFFFTFLCIYYIIYIICQLKFFQITDLDLFQDDLY